MNTLGMTMAEGVTRATDIGASCCTAVPVCDTVVGQGISLAAALAEITRTFERAASTIWSTAFQPQDIPCLFLGSGCDGTPIVWSFNTEFSAQELLTLTVDGDRTLVCHGNASLERPPSGFAIGCDIADDCVVLFDLDGDIPPVADMEFRRFVVHETFHYFQLFIESWKLPEQFDPFTPAVHLAVDRDLEDLELELIESAVDADASEFDILVNGFCRTRRHRHRLTTPERQDLVSQECGLEQIEGMARYVENRYAEQNDRPGRLVMPPEAQSGSVDWYSAGRLYRTGARVGETLDRLGVDWRPRLRIGQSPAQILIEVSNASSGAIVDLREGTVAVP